MGNLHYLFNIEYYSGWSHEHFAKCNDAIVKQQYKSGELIPPFVNVSSFQLQTAYPGLLIGVGNVHEAGRGVSEKEEEPAEIKLGFTLDYVTGLPLIPGSTVKGALHGAFANYEAYVQNILTERGATVVDMDTLTRYIFGDPNPGSCVFYDAIPVKPGQGDRLFGLDNITPHNKPYDRTKDDGGAEYQMNGLKNPIPLTMLKVIPGVTYLFRFDLSALDRDGIIDSKIASCTFSEIVSCAFKEILSDIGIGAKTNVGYGVLTECAEQEVSATWLVPYSGR